MGFNFGSIFKVGSDILSGNWGDALKDGVGAAVDAVTGLPVGSLITGAWDAYNARSAANTAWDRQMSASNTSYQRGVVDMMKAGLNPGLSYTRGGASTPGAPVASMPNMGQENASSASAAAAMASIQNTRADTRLKEAQTVGAIANARQAAAATDAKGLERVIGNTATGAAQSRAGQFLQKSFAHPLDQIMSTDWLQQLGIGQPAGK